MKFRPVTWLCVLAACVVLGAGARAQEKQAVTPAALEGAWRLASLSYDSVKQEAIGYMLFHGSYYSFVTTRTRPKLTAEIARKPVEALTDAEKMLYIEAYGSMTAAGGTFTIEDGAIHYLREAVRSPHLQGQKEHRKSWLEGGKLIQDFEGGGRRQVYVWERVSGPSAMGRQ